MEHQGRDDSLAPVAIERARLQAEAALFHRGRAWSLLRAGTLTGLTACAVLMAVDAMEAAESRQRARTSLRTVHHGYFDAFLQCALPDTLPERVVDRESLLAAFERNANREGEGYGALLDECLGPLTKLSASLRSVPVPDDARGQRRLLTELARQILVDFRAYVVHLQSPGAADYVKSLALADRVAGDCLAYEAAHERLREEILD